MVLVLFCILLASSLGYFYFKEVGYHQDAKSFRGRRDIVGVIAVEGPIISSKTASLHTDIINQVLLDENVRAVVLMVDSPGGYAEYIEQIYLDILELKEAKPLVASVVSALSGGYYLSVASDYIYIHPTSMIGNVGVLGVGPPTLMPSEMVFETGAFKATGFSKLLFPFNLTHALDNFVSAVEVGRGSRLTLSSAQLRRGMVYLGSEAIRAGLADEKGSLQNAIERVAMEAGLDEYEVVDLNQLYEASGPFSSSYNQTLEWRELTGKTLSSLHPLPAMYYLYLPSDPLAKGVTRPETQSGVASENITATRGGELVIVDNTHGNKVSPWELDILIWELAKRNITVSFPSDWDELRSSLMNASCLIVASPTEDYSVEEARCIEDFVDDGRLLLLIFDPAIEYLEVPTLFGPINSIANRFRLSYTKGYLYNEEAHYGFYRNIYVRNFADCNLTRGLSSLVLFTAARICSNDGVAWTSGDTYSSTAERIDNYTTIAWATGNGMVAAIGDLTFLIEPYCYVEDNYRLILNIAETVAGIKIPITEAPVKAPIEEVAEPVLPVGTEKIFNEKVNELERIMRWVMVSETEVRVERPDRTSHFYYDEEGSLLRWKSNGMEVIFENPLPKAPYPLTKGEIWEYKGKYNVTIFGDELPGTILEEGEVLDFEDVETEEGKSYFCAKVDFRVVNEVRRDDTRFTIVSKGYSWISHEAGIVKEERLTLTYVNNFFSMKETRRLKLKSIKKGHTRSP